MFIIVNKALWKLLWTSKKAPYVRHHFDIAGQIQFNSLLRGGVCDRNVENLPSSYHSYTTCKKSAMLVWWTASLIYTFFSENNSSVKENSTIYYTILKQARNLRLIFCRRQDLCLYKSTATRPCPITSISISL